MYRVTTPFPPFLHMGRTTSSLPSSLRSGCIGAFSGRGGRGPIRTWKACCGAPVQWPAVELRAAVELLPPCASACGRLEALARSARRLGRKELWCWRALCGGWGGKSGGGACDLCALATIGWGFTRLFVCVNLWLLACLVHDCCIVYLCALLNSLT